MAKVKPARSLLTSMIAALMAAPVAQAAWRFTPSVDMRETWSDNVNQAPSGQEESRLVTTLSPGFSLSNETPRLKLHADYRLNMYAYSGSRPSGNNSNSQTLSADAKAQLVGDELFLDAHAAISQVAASGFGPPVTGAGFVSTNRNEVRSYSISPYLRHGFGTLANLEMRYVHDLVTSDNAGFGRSSSDLLSMGLSSGPTFRKFGWTLNASRQVIDDSIANTSTQTMANASLRYSLSQQFTMNVGGGYDEFEYDAAQGETKGAYYSVGFQWIPSARTSLQASAGRRFYGASYSLSAQHRSRRSSWNISYDDAVTNSRSQFTLPSAVSTAALLDSLFAATIPDPVRRAAAVQAYIAATGLPSALPNAINYLSNRYTLQRQFIASTAFQLAHSSAVLSAFRTKREALSNVSADSALLGNQNSLLNDNTDQSGLSAALNYRLGPRSQLSLTATSSKIESVSTGRTDHNRQLSLFLSRQFASKLSGVAEVRRVRGTTFGTGDKKFTENALAVGLAMTL